MYNLAAMNTMFQPKKHASVHTFLQTKRTDADDKYIGRTVKVKYKGKWTTGKVIEPSLITQHPAWIVRYQDGYIKTYSERKLKKILVHVTTKKNGHQIDYICVSRRWRSSVSNCEVRWAPSKHRSLHGDREDHGLLASTWN